MSKKDDLATGQHYKQYLIRPEHVGQPLDPAMIVEIRGEYMRPMLFTALKKVLECGGRGVKTYKQDVEGAIGALERELELIKLKESDEMGAKDVAPKRKFYDLFED